MKHRCLQSKCAYLNNGIGCKKCDECKTTPYLINNECKRCLACQDEEGKLRWDEGEGREDEKMKEKMKEEIKIIMKGDR